jgi:hypothetical protein
VTYLLLYVPVCLAALLVYETCRHDDPAVIVRKALKDFGLLTAIFGVAAAVVYLVNRFA